MNINYIYDEKLLNITSVIRIYDFSYKLKIHNIMYYENENFIKWKYCNLPFNRIIFIQHILNGIYFYYHEYNISTVTRVNYISIKQFLYTPKIKIQFLHTNHIMTIYLHPIDIININNELKQYKIIISIKQINEFIEKINSYYLLKELRE